MSLFEKCLTQFKEKIGNIEIKVTNITYLVKFSMEVVETTQLKGKEQNEMAMKLVRKIVVDAPISDDEEKLLLRMIDEGVLGNVVDLVVDATKGNINVNNVKQISVGCCKALCK